MTPPLQGRRYSVRILFTIITAIIFTPVFFLVVAVAQGWSRSHADTALPDSLTSAVAFVAALSLAYPIAGLLSRWWGRLGIDRQPTQPEFRILFDSAPNGVCLINRAGVILLANRWMADKFGYSCAELIGTPIRTLVPMLVYEDPPLLARKIALAPKTGSLSIPENLYGQHRNGSEFPIELSPSPLEAGGANVILLWVLDISARQQLTAAEVALGASEEQRTLAIEAAGVGLWNWDLTNNQMWWSDHMRQIIGVPLPMPASHAMWYDRVHPADRHLVHEIFSRRRAGERYHEYEYRITRLDDGAIRDLSSKGQTRFDDSGKPVSVLGVVQDITARKAAERARDDLRRALMRAQEQERLRLARELHDEAGQSLAAVQMQLKRIESVASETERTSLRALHSQLEQMGAALHRISLELRPASIDELGLTAVLGNYISEWSSHFSVAADFHCGDTNLDQASEDIRTTIYRVTQEALTNIGKHARGVTAVSVVLARVGGEIRLTIEDNGCGIAAGAPQHGPTRPGGLGFAGMRERLALIGGSLQVESSSQGCTIFARIAVSPVPRPSPDGNGPQEIIREPTLTARSSQQA